MCSKTDNNNNNKNNSNAATLNLLTTATITQTKLRKRAYVKRRKSHSTCMWWHYQLKPGYLQSSHRTLNKNKTSIDAAAAPPPPTSPQPTAFATPFVSSQRFCHFVTLFTIGLIFVWMDNGVIIRSTSAAPQSCILCDKDDLQAKDPSSSSFEEFLFDHQVTRLDAINALKALNESFYIGPPPENSCRSVSCSPKVMKYCLGPKFINDHCWCELGHNDEGLPFVPHICYVGEKVYKTTVGSCFFYEEVKECCCSPALAKQWRHISGTPSTQKINRSFYLLSLALLILYVAGRKLKNLGV